jgi:TPR repeat protein
MADIFATVPKEMLLAMRRGEPAAQYDVACYWAATKTTPVRGSGAEHAAASRALMIKAATGGHAEAQSAVFDGYAVIIGAPHALVALHEVSHFQVQGGGERAELGVSALELLQRAAAQGHAKAKATYADIRRMAANDAFNPFDPDREELLLFSGPHPQNPEDSTHRAIYSVCIPRQTLAAAEGGDDPQAAFGVGNFFEKKNRRVKGAVGRDGLVAWSVTWWKRAAEKGHAEARRSIGLAHATGRGLPQSWEMAARHWRLAADAGDAESQYELGTCCFYGRGTGRDVEEAKAWFGKAAAQETCKKAEEIMPSGVPGSSIRARLDGVKDVPLFTTMPKAQEAFACVHVVLFLVDVFARGGMMHIDEAKATRRLDSHDWTHFMIHSGISAEEMALVKRYLEGSGGTEESAAEPPPPKLCPYCNAPDPTNFCSLCMNAKYCNAECARRDWKKEPSSESHQTLCSRVVVRGTKGSLRV